MASRKFRFVSPGVFLREIDNSQLPRESEAIGPIVIGRTRKGPGMKPYKVKSLEEFERVFGKCMPGNQGEDPWRDGTDILAESYAPYAAKAFLTSARDTDAPLTVVRLLGVAGDDAGSGDGEPGWIAQQTIGLFLAKVDNQNNFQSPLDLNLAAIFYSTKASTDFDVKVKGTPVGNGQAGTETLLGKAVLENNGKFTVVLSDKAATTKEVQFAFEDIRKEFNTNPVSTNDRISSPTAKSLAGSYWLGETFDDVHKKMKAQLAEGEKLAVLALNLSEQMGDFQSTRHQMSSARTGWVFGQDTSGDANSFTPESQQRLFRLIALHEGIEASKSLIIGIEDIKVAREGATNRFGTFSVVVRRVGSTRLEVLERFDNCNLDPSSENFIAKKIGDQYFEWSPSEKRNKIYGEHPNVSEHIRVEMNLDIITGGGPSNVEHVPFGFYGPIVPDDLTITITDEQPAQPQVDAVAAQASFDLSQMPAPGELIQITDAAGSVDSFIFSITKDTTNTRDVDGKLEIGIQTAEAGSDLPAAALQIKAAIEQSVAENQLAVTVAIANNTTIQITQAAVGTLGNSDQNGDLSHTLGEKLSNFTNFAGGVDFAAAVDAVVDFTQNPGAWANSIADFTNTGLSSGHQVKVNWPESLVVNQASLDQGFYHGFTPFLRTFDSNGESVVTGKINKSYVDYLRKMSDFNSALLEKSQASGIKDAGVTKYSFIFSLDEVVLEKAPRADLASIANIRRRGDVLKSYWEQGSRDNAAPDRAYTHYITDSTLDASDAYSRLLDIVDGFQMPMAGGFDGTNIIEADPFNAFVVSDKTTSDSYAYASIDRAIELIKDAEAVEHNIALMPGISEESLTTKLVNTCEARADSLAIIDLPDVYKPPFEESCDFFQQRMPDAGNPENSAKNLVGRQINSSYGCTYYPWVKIKDESYSRDVWVPPSVVALGVMGYTESNADVWFAPAGFNRGGLNQGNAGLPVLQVTEQLLSKDRDTLYAANINPIASFVSEGIVIFGQKTLQMQQSALDRINVRRLLIFVKKEISRISSNLLFEPNVQATWARFHSKAKEMLDSVKVRFGLTDYKVVLDTTTTTPDLIDRNIMYAKIFLKPARAIEFIAVDFVITNTGAEYDD